MPKKRRLSSSALPTAQEISAYHETETLYKSNLFRLQTQELLEEVSGAVRRRAM